MLHVFQSSQHYRWGSPTPSGPSRNSRPLLVSFKELDTKKGLFRNLKELGKDGAPEDLKNLSVSHDMTEQERKENRELVDKAKKRDTEDPTHKHIVRGAPWNREIVAILRK